MTWLISEDADNRLVVARIRDRFDDVEFDQYIESMEHRGPFPDGHRLVLLIDDDTEITVTSEAVRTFSRRPAQFAPAAMRVIVAGSELAFGLSRMFSLSAPSASDQYVIVRTLAEAAALLGVDPDRIDMA